MQVKLTKVPKGATKMSAKVTPRAAPAGFNLQDNGDDTFTVLGADAAGNTLDISAVATLTAVSDTPAVVTVDPPTGMTSAIHAAVPAPKVGATANITLTATWNDTTLGIGPFTITWPISITAGPAGGIVVTPGVPTVH
jgi:hypothetical protein